MVPSWLQKFGLLLRNAFFYIHTRRKCEYFFHLPYYLVALFGVGYQIKTKCHRFGAVRSSSNSPPIKILPWPLSLSDLGTIDISYTLDGASQTMAGEN